MTQHLAIPGSANLQAHSFEKISKGLIAQAIGEQFESATIAQRTYRDETLRKLPV